MDFSHAPDKEFMMVAITAFMAYCVGEVLRLSGVMTLFFSALVLAHYNWYNLSLTSRKTTRNGFTAISKLAEQVVFLYLGGIFSISLHPKQNYEWDGHLVWITLLLCFLARFLYVAPLTMLDNCFRRMAGQKEITAKMTFVIWFSGMRGSVAFALVMNIADDTNPLLTTSIIVCLITLTLCGSVMEPVLERFALIGANINNPLIGAMGGEAVLYGQYDSQSTVADINMEATAILDTEGQSRCNCCTKRAFRNFDEKYMKPCFGGRSHDRTFVPGRYDQNGTMSNLSISEVQQRNQYMRQKSESEVSTNFKAQGSFTKYGSNF